MSISFSEDDDWPDDWSEDFDDRDGSYWEQYLGGPNGDNYHQCTKHETWYYDGQGCPVCTAEPLEWDAALEDVDEDTSDIHSPSELPKQEELFMASVNKAIIIGNLGRDPEVRFTQSGQAMARFSVATTDTWMDQENGRQERTEWHNIVVWGKQAEHCGQYLSKGRQVYIEGRIQTRKFEDREGKERYFTEINARQVTFLGGRGEEGRSGQYESGGAGSGAGGYEAPPVPDDDDVPF